MDQGSNVSPGNNQPALTWRDVLPVHPAAELLPRMSNAELEELRTDIAANGLHTPVIILLSDDGTEQLLDGINRLDAMALAGKKVVKEDGTFNHDEVLHQHVRGNTDPYRFVLSVNLYRRHLTNEQKTDLIAKLLELKPAASDRQIASLTGTSHPTVAKVRREMTAGGKITTSPTRTDKRGREQPATKPSTAAATTAITGMPVAEPESKVCMPVVDPKPEAAGSNFKEPDVFAPLWNVIEASDRVAEVGRHESTQVALGALTSTGQKKIQKSLRELCGILKILRGELAKVVNVTKTGDINKPVGDPPTLSRRCRVSMFNK
jgi:hypothetical protein